MGARRQALGENSRMEFEIDACGLYCPIPILRLSKVLRDSPPGSIALLRATDPAVVADVEVFCRDGRYRVEDSRRDGEIFLFRIRKN